MKTTLIFTCALALAGAAMGQKVKSKAESEMVNAVLSARTPDDKIAATDKLLAKYKDTEFKGVVLELAGEAYEQKGDSVNAIIYGNRALEADPKSYTAMLLVARQTAQGARENDLDLDDKVKHVNQLDNDALAALAVASKPNPQLTDDQWAGAKKEFTGQAHNTMGVMAAAAKKYDVAVTEFNASISDTNDPVTMIRLADVYNKMRKYSDAAAAADKALATPNLSANIAKFAQDEKATAQKGMAK